MKALFTIKKPHTVPDMEYLVYQFGDETRGGYTLQEEFDDFDVYWIDTSPEHIFEMKEDTEKYKWLKDLDEE